MYGVPHDRYTPWWTRARPCGVLLWEQGGVVGDYDGLFPYMNPNHEATHEEQARKVDDDVIDEEARVAKMISAEGAELDAVVVHELCKVYSLTIEP